MRKKREEEEIKIEIVFKVAFWNMADLENKDVNFQRCFSE